MSGLYLTKVAELADVMSGGGAPQDPSAFSEDGHPFVRAGSLSRLLNGESEDNLEHIRPDVARSYRLQLFPRGTVLFAKSGMSATKGYIHALRKPAYVVNHLAALLPHDPSDSGFLLRALQHFSPTSLIKDQAYPSIRLGEIETMEVLAPRTVDERARIAAILDKADAQRRKRKRAIELLDSLTQSIFLEMFARGESTDGYTIGQLCVPVETWTPTRFPDAPPFNYIDIGSVDQDTKAIVKTTIVKPTTAPSRARQKVSSGDVLVSMVRPNLNAVAIVPADLHGATASTGFCVLRPRIPATTTQFLYAVARSRPFIKSMVEQATGASYPAVTDRIVKSFMLPSIALEHLGHFSKVVKMQQNQLTSMMRGQAHAEQLFSSLQHRTFSGSGQL